jgi:hypothetical protein
VAQTICFGLLMALNIFFKAFDLKDQAIKRILRLEVAK